MICITAIYDTGFCLSFFLLSSGPALKFAAKALVESAMKRFGRRPGKMEIRHTFFFPFCPGAIFLPPLSDRQLATPFSALFRFRVLLPVPFEVFFLFGGCDDVLMGRIES